MSDIPRVWWLPDHPDGEYTAHVVQETPDGLICPDGWHNEIGEHDGPLRADAIPLVPQASRDDLREAIARRIEQDSVPCGASVELDYIDQGLAETVDAVLDLLTDCGLVAHAEEDDQ